MVDLRERNTGVIVDGWLRGVWLCDGGKEVRTEAWDFCGISVCIGRWVWGHGVATDIKALPSSRFEMLLYQAVLILVAEIEETQYRTTTN